MNLFTGIVDVVQQLPLGIPRWVLATVAAWRVHSREMHCETPPHPRVWLAALFHIKSKNRRSRRVALLFNALLVALLAWYDFSVNAQTQHRRSKGFRGMVIIGFGGAELGARARLRQHLRC